MECLVYSPHDIVFLNGIFINDHSHNRNDHRHAARLQNGAEYHHQNHKQHGLLLFFIQQDIQFF